MAPNSLSCPSVDPLGHGVTDPVRSTSCVSSTRLKEPPSAVRLSTMFCNTAWDDGVSPSRIHQCHHPDTLGTILLFSCPSTQDLILGEVTRPGNIYGPPRSHHKRWQEYPFDPYSWQTGRLGYRQDRRTNELEEVMEVCFSGNPRKFVSFIY